MSEFGFPFLFLLSHHLSLSLSLLIDHWVCMMKSVAECPKCESCRLRKTSQQIKWAPMQIFGKVSRRFEGTAMDNGWATYHPGRKQIRICVFRPLHQISLGYSPERSESGNGGETVLRKGCSEARCTTIGAYRFGRQLCVLVDDGYVRMAESKEAPHNGISSGRKRCS